jgi:hypothetical protein
MIFIKVARGDELPFAPADAPITSRLHSCAVGGAPVSVHVTFPNSPLPTSLQPNRPRRPLPPPKGLIVGELMVDRNGGGVPILGVRRGGGVM